MFPPILHIHPLKHSLPSYCPSPLAFPQVSDANPEARKLIHSHFREWLVNSGNLRHVLDLLYYEDKDPTP